MNCPLCGGRTVITKTDRVHETLVCRTRGCTNALCPYAEKTFEALKIDEERAGKLIEDLVDLFIEIAKHTGREDVVSRLLRAARFKGSE
jgi:hypothetical protein